MDHAGGVRALQAAGDLGDDPQRLADGRRAALEQRPQRATLHQLHRDEDRVTVLAHLVDRGDRRVAHGRRRLRLAQEALAPPRVADEIGRQHLQGDGPAQVLVLGLVDEAHPALADLGQDAEVREALLFHGCDRREFYRMRVRPEAVRTLAQEAQVDATDAVFPGVDRANLGAAAERSFGILDLDDLTFVEGVSGHDASAARSEVLQHRPLLRNARFLKRTLRNIVPRFQLDARASRGRQDPSRNRTAAVCR